MRVKKKAVARRKPKARASTAVMIKRYEKRLAKLKERQKLQLIKAEVSELQRELERRV
jgi:hypothetical protein